MLLAGRSLRDLGTIELSWHELRLLIRRWAATPGTAVYESLGGKVWSRTDQMLAHLIDAVNSGFWRLSVATTRKHTARPKPFPRPWDKRGRTVGSDPIPLNTFDSWWDSQK